MKTDVVVVGSGAAGLLAALAAADKGADVTLLERSPLFGGTSAESGGNLWLPNNSLQTQSGIKDSFADAEAYLRRLTVGLVPDDVLLAFVKEAPNAFDLMARETGLKFAFASAHEGPAQDLNPGFPGAGSGRSVSPGSYDMARLKGLGELIRHPTWPGGIPPLHHQEMAAFQDRGERWGWVPLAKERIAKGIAVRGYALAAGLVEACARRGVKLTPNSRGSELIHQNGTVTGIRAMRDGRSETYDTRLGVVLACGGFEWNTAMWDDFTKIPIDGRFSPRLNDGDGLRMAMQVGARLTRLHQAYLQPTVGAPPVVEDGVPRLRLDLRRLPLPGSIAVNRRGERFANEAGDSAQWVQAMIRFDPIGWDFPNLPAFLVFDRRNRESYPLLWEDWSVDAGGDERPDWLVEAPTLRPLAERLGIDPVRLEEQVKEFNAHAERGQDPVFHRGGAATPDIGDPRFSNATLRPLGPGPYYAYRLQLGAWGNRGGPVVDGNAQVLGLDDRPIRGLYAVGTTAASVTGTAYPSGGGALGPGVTLGYIAGRALTSA